MLATRGGHTSRGKSALMRVSARLFTRMGPKINKVILHVLFTRPPMTTEGSSVLAAEMEAIGRAIEWATTANIPHVVVFSDSLGSVESLENQRSGSRSRQLMDLMYALDDYAVRTKYSLTIVWIPGHLGIPGNATADNLYKRALHLDAVDIPTTLEYREARTIYRDSFLRKWQAE